MKWKKSPATLVAMFDDVAPKGAGVERKKMFGYPCAFANRQLFIGLHQDNMVLKLGDKDRDAFIQKYAAEIFSPMPGRTMREYVVVPHKLFTKKPELRKWIGKSLAYVQARKK
jgi:TfoX/Sxy family transcriptional regulator of competence genes